MNPIVCRYFALFATFLPLAATLNAQSSRKALSQGDMMTLVAGGCVDEDIAAEVKTRGIAFSVSDDYVQLLKSASAEPKTLAALAAARGAATAQAESGPIDSFVTHLAKAGELIQAKNYEGAAQEARAIYQAGAAADAEFVLGRVFEEADDWQDAGGAYQATLEQSPGFVEAHIKMSGVLYHVGDFGEALQEAKLALTQMPDSAEARKNAALAADDMDAAALR